MKLYQIGLRSAKKSWSTNLWQAPGASLKHETRCQFQKRAAHSCMLQREVCHHLVGGRRWRKYQCPSSIEGFVELRTPTVAVLKWPSGQTSPLAAHHHHPLSAQCAVILPKLYQPPTSDAQDHLCLEQQALQRYPRPATL